MEPNTEQFRNNLRSLRQRSGLSQEQMAARLGVKRSSYSGWENGVSEPGLKHLMAIQRAHGIGLDVLLAASLDRYTADDLQRARQAWAPRPRIAQPNVVSHAA